MKPKVWLPKFFLVCGFVAVSSHTSYPADLRLSLQNSYVPWLEVSTPAPRELHTERQPLPENIGDSAPSVSNRAWTMGGYAVHASIKDTVEQFLSYSEHQIRSQLNVYLTANPTLSPQAKDLIILDMEHPVHPKDLGKYKGAQQTQIVEAFKTRIKVVRQQFPKAKLSIYGVILPNPQGDSSTAKFKQMMQGYIRAGQLGMFDDLDYLSPVLYLRFAPGEKTYNYIEAYTRQGLEASREVQTSKGMQLRLVPFLSPKVFNGGSKYDQQCAPVESIQNQLRIIRQYPYVETVVLWVGDAESATSTEWCSPQKLVQSLTLKQ